MSELSQVLPAAVYALRDDYDGDGPFATAMYNQWTSGIAPDWFGSIQPSAQSFLLYDNFPNNLEEPMTLALSRSASPAAVPTSGSSSTAAPSTFSTSVSASSAMASSTPVMEPIITASHSRTTAIATGTVIPIVALGILGSVILWLVIRRRRDRTRRREAGGTGDPHPLEPDRQIRRWSETTFSTTQQKLRRGTSIPRCRRLEYRRLLATSRLFSEASALIAISPRAQSSPGHPVMSPRPQQPMFHTERAFRLTVRPLRCVRSQVIVMIGSLSQETKDLL